MPGTELGVSSPCLGLILSGIRIECERNQREIYYIYLQIANSNMRALQMMTMLWGEIERSSLFLAINCIASFLSSYSGRA